MSENKLNEISFQYADFQNAIRPTSDNPTEIFPNGVYLGQNINTPQTTTQKKYQFRDDFSWSMSDTSLQGRRQLRSRTDVGRHVHNRNGTPVYAPVE